MGDVPTGHAIINVDPQAENSIVIFAGANAAIGADQVADALARAKAGDTLMLQNETSSQVVAAQMAQARGMRVIYSAAPFDLGTAAGRFALCDDPGDE